MSSYNKTLSSAISSSYNLMVSKLISLLQSHLIQLIYPNKPHLSTPTTSQIDNKHQKYNFVLGKMKILEQQQSISPKYSKLCQPLLNTLFQLQSNLPSSSQNQFHKSRSVSSKRSRLDSLSHSLDQSFQQNTPSMKNSLNLKKTNQGRHTVYYEKNVKPSKPADPIKITKVNKHLQTLRDFQKYQSLTEKSQLAVCVSQMPIYCQNQYEPKPGETLEQTDKFRGLRDKNNKEKRPNLPNQKSEIILSRKKFGNQITNRTMTEFSRSNQLDRIDEQGQAETNLDGVDQKQLYSFEIVETPNGTVYCKQEQVNQHSRFKVALYKRFIDRAHLNRVGTQFS